MAVRESPVADIKNFYVADVQEDRKVRGFLFYLN